MKIKKAKGTKKCAKAAQIDGKIKYLQKKKFNEDNLKEFVKNKLTQKIQQRFKSERYVFTKEISKIPLSSNDDKRKKSIDSNEKYAYGTSKDTICVKEKIKRYNIIKRCLTSIMSQKKT